MSSPPPPPAILFLGAPGAGKSTLLGFAWDAQAGNLWYERCFRSVPPGPMRRTAMWIRGQPYTLVESQHGIRNWEYPGVELAAMLSAVATTRQLAAIVIAVVLDDVDRLTALLVAWQSFFPPQVFARMAVVVTRTAEVDDLESIRRLKNIVAKVLFFHDVPTRERVYEHNDRTVVKPLLAIASQKPIFTAWLVRLYSVAQARQKVLRTGGPLSTSFVAWEDWKGRRITRALLNPPHDHPQRQDVRRAPKLRRAQSYPVRTVPRHREADRAPGGDR